jgi:hypothetical protein
MIVLLAIGFLAGVITAISPSAEAGCFQNACSQGGPAAPDSSLTLAINT